ncbi:hypothetical protein WA026_007196 [Henosepilachna vigintioctopunctata]|uniref:Uncharacterized protein n=1 Tax=Henosepilachna vigintioctopunctata TaxID=420089 RepID=A0AAW1VD13_9CUCU
MENEVQIQSLVKKLFNIYNAYKWSRSKLNLRKKKYLAKTKKGELHFKETSEIDTEIETTCHQRNIFVFTQTLPGCRKLNSYLNDPRKTKSSYSLLKEYSSQSSSTDFKTDSSYQWVCRCDSYASLQTYGNYHSVNVCTCPSCCCKKKKKYGTVNKKSITEIKGVKNTTIAILPKSVERLDETTITNADETKEVQVPPEYAASTSGILIKHYEDPRSILLGCDCKCEHNRRSVACQNSPGYCRICSTITFLDSSTPESIAARKSLQESTSSSTCSCPCEPSIVNKSANCRCCTNDTVNSCRQACVQTADRTCCCSNSLRRQSVATEIQRDKILVPTQYADDADPSQNISLILSDDMEKELMPEAYRDALPTNGDRYRRSIAMESRSQEKFLNGDRHRQSIAMDSRSQEKFLNGDRHRQRSAIDSRSQEQFLNGDRHRQSIAMESRSQEKFLNGDRHRQSIAMESRSQEKFLNPDRHRQSIAMESRSQEKFLNGHRHRQSIAMESRSQEKFLNGDRHRQSIAMESRSQEKFLNGDRPRQSIALESQEQFLNGDRQRRSMTMDSRSREQFSNSNRIPSETFGRSASMGLPSASTTHRTAEIDDNRPFWADLPKDFFLNLKSCECTCPRCLGIDKLNTTQTTNLLFENKIKDYYADLSQCLKNMPNNSLNSYPLRHKSSEVGTINEGVNTYNSVVVQTYTSSTHQSMHVGTCRQVNECCTCGKYAGSTVVHSPQASILVGGSVKGPSVQYIPLENTAQSRTTISQMNTSTSQRQPSQFTVNNLGKQGLDNCNCCCPDGKSIVDDDIFIGLGDTVGETDPFPGLTDTTKEEIRDLLKNMEETLHRESRLHKKNLTGIMKQLTKQAGEIKELKVHVKSVIQTKKTLTCQDVEKKLRKLDEIKKKEERQRKEKKKRKQRMEKEKKEKEKEKEKQKRKGKDSETCCKCSKQKNIGR